MIEIRVGRIVGDGFVVETNGVFHLQRAIARYDVPELRAVCQFEGLSAAGKIDEKGRDLLESLRRKSHRSRRLSSPWRTDSAGVLHGNRVAQVWLPLLWHL